MTHTKTLGLAAAGALALAGAAQAAIGDGCIDRTKGLCYPYNTTPAGARGITFSLADVDAAWIGWRTTHIDIPHENGFNSANCNGCKKVWKSDNTAGFDRTTTSESTSYGMLMAMLFDEQSLFDDLWAYARHSSIHGKIGLVEWCTRLDNSVCNPKAVGSASDATWDIGLALVFANKKVEGGAWAPSSRFGNYSADARAVLDNSWSDEVNAKTDRFGGAWPRVGNNWDKFVMNPSYFSPGHWRVFDEFENATRRWSAVVAKAAQNIDANQAHHGGCSGLIFNWTTESGSVGAGTFENDGYTWEAVRIPWRQSLAKLWYDDAEAAETLNEFGSFFEDVPFASMQPMKMDGTPYGNSGRQVAFVVQGALAIWASDATTDPAACGLSQNANNTRQSAWDAVVANVERSATYPTPGYSYFNNYWRLAALMTMSGNMPNLLAGKPGGGSPSSTTP